ncbi:winged helix-turn-helix domain-containing protein [Pseudoalteromonas sp. T1lg65]|uniref:winged helix-turn-helix domain-containing protein n=1 Tax=Pseudoalteromonas sp. T1lg65 TaxID=2077101 RepID=UPI003F7ADFBE
MDKHEDSYHFITLFGSWEYIRSHNLLIDRCDLTPKYLDPRLSSLLSVFLESQGEMLSFQQLDALLPEQISTNPENLYSLLQKLKRVLGDSERRPKYIKTIPNEGYCFFSEIEEYYQQLMLPDSNSSIAFTDYKVS